MLQITMAQLYVLFEFKSLFDFFKGSILFLRLRVTLPAIDFFIYLIYMKKIYC